MGNHLIGFVPDSVQQPPPDDLLKNNNIVVASRLASLRLVYLLYFERTYALHARWIELDRGIHT